VKGIKEMDLIPQKKKKKKLKTKENIKSKKRDGM